MSLRAAFLPRQLHPGAWWAWALGLATAAVYTTNPLLLLLIVAVTGYVVAARRTNAPWARSYAAFLRLGLLVVALRVAFQVVFGASGVGTVIVHVPVLPVPDWAGGEQYGAGEHEKAGVAEGELEANAHPGGSIHGVLHRAACRCGSPPRPQWR
jgi:energy-coupling factor transport system permease protein